MREEKISNAEQAFVKEALAASIRVDGRQLQEPRRLQIHLHHEDGSAEVTIGTTRAVAVVYVEAVAPYPDRPSEGIISFAAEFSPAASERFAYEYGAIGVTISTSEEATLLTRAVERAIRESRALDTESLCILAGKLVWSLKVNVQVIDHCGNALDAAEIAALSALKNTRRPEVTISGTEVTIHPVTHREPIPIPVHHVPVSVSFGLFDNGAAALIDPSLQEELTMEGTVTIIANAHGELCGVHKTGGAPVEPGLLMMCIKIAVSRAKEITSVLGEVLDDKLIRQHQDESVIVDPVKAVENMVISESRADSDARATKTANDQMDVDNLISVAKPPPPIELPFVQEKPLPPSDPLNTGNHRNSASGTAKDGSSNSTKPGAEVEDLKATNIVDSDEDSEESNDSSDEDLMSAVISRPRGGGGKRSAKKGK
eukprot:Plantae.Rhodophyta-Purpureofilum_apyrenoidigerum.ctg11251.p1 GENE.Plantae.Rhodophyta-Purpureofilum_apyrenoidigerum.ctg11251~~Plantae.Rhodophyta-Purpureofilum_apyrenoidigerum.ctg11251.p1  ORF type:complete len:428 (-),score=67.49 Plantae.Rhodophyta-Purpureofilum_apyrenoidigerum.ctg11251:221-1504(-)